MTAEQVLTVMTRLIESGSEAWLDGGWGVDALLGKQTRDHHDLDLVVELTQIDAIEEMLKELGTRERKTSSRHVCSLEPATATGSIYIRSCSTKGVAGFRRCRTDGPTGTRRRASLAEDSSRGGCYPA